MMTSIYLPETFSGEMIKAYESACIAKGTVRSRTLRNGKSLQFIYTGRMTVTTISQYSPSLGSGDPPVAEKTIVMDDLWLGSLSCMISTKPWLTTACVPRSRPRSSRSG